MRPLVDLLERVLWQTRHSEVPLIKVVLEPVPVGARPAGEHDGLVVGGREVLVPEQLQVVLRVWHRRVDAV